MKKLMLVAAILAVVVVAVAPVIAQPVSQEFSESSTKSGAATPKVEIKNSGNNVDLCPTSQQIVNTGNVLNEQGVVQYQTKTDDILFNPDTPTQITITPSVTAECTQTIEQAAAAK